MSGPKSQKRVGLLIPHTDTTLEFDLKRMLPNNISIHTERMWLDNVTISAEKKMLKEETPRAIRYLQPIQPDIAVFGCTSAGAIYGIEGDQTIKKNMTAELSCRSVSAFSAVIDYLRELGLQNLAVMTPYINDVTARVADGLQQYGFNIVFTCGMGLNDDIEIGRITPKDIIKYVKINKKNIESGDVLFLSCTNLRALECKEALESLLNMKVVTSNEAILKQVLHYFQS